MKKLNVVGSILLANVKNLESISTLSSLEKDTVLERFDLLYLNSLESLDGLESLKEVTLNFSVGYNEKLPACEVEALATQVGRDCAAMDTGCILNEGTGTCD